MLLATSVFGVGRLLRLRGVVDGQRRVHAGSYHVVDETQPARESLSASLAWSSARCSRSDLDMT